MSLDHNNIIRAAWFLRTACELWISIMIGGRMQPGKNGIDMKVDLIIINFIVCLVLVKGVTNLFMRAVGADLYFFDIKKRLIFCAAAAVILSFFGI